MCLFCVHSKFMFNVITSCFTFTFCNIQLMKKLQPKELTAIPKLQEFLRQSWTKYLESSLSSPIFIVLCVDERPWCELDLGFSFFLTVFIFFAWKRLWYQLVLQIFISVDNLLCACEWPWNELALQVFITLGKVFCVYEYPRCELALQSFISLDSVLCVNEWYWCE